MNEAERNDRRGIWRGHIDRWRASGLSQTDFCQQQNLRKEYFSRWKGKLKPGQSHSQEKLIEIPVALAQTGAGLAESLQADQLEKVTIKIKRDEITITLER